MIRNVVALYHLIWILSPCTSTNMNKPFQLKKKKNFCCCQTQIDLSNKNCLTKALGTPILHKRHAPWKKG